jgi:hypothetical protein
MTTSPHKLLSLARESGGAVHDMGRGLYAVTFGEVSLPEFVERIRQDHSAEDLAILEAVRREMDEDDGGNAPGHSHSRPGIWDDDNVPSKAGKPCAWCLTWSKFTALIERERAAIRSISTTESKGGGA